MKESSIVLKTLIADLKNNVGNFYLIPLAVFSIVVSAALNRYFPEFYLPELQISYYLIIIIIFSRKKIWGFISSLLIISGILFIYLAGYTPQFVPGVFLLILYLIISLTIFASSFKTEKNMTVQNSSVNNFEEDFKVDFHEFHQLKKARALLTETVEKNLRDLEKQEELLKTMLSQLGSIDDISTPDQWFRQLHQFFLNLTGLENISFYRFNDSNKLILIRIFPEPPVRDESNPPVSVEKNNLDSSSDQEIIKIMSQKYLEPNSADSDKSFNQSEINFNPVPGEFELDFDIDQNNYLVQFWKSRFDKKDLKFNPAPINNSFNSLGCIIWRINCMPAGIINFGNFPDQRPLSRTDCLIFETAVNLFTAVANKTGIEFYSIPELIEQICLTEAELIHRQQIQFSFSKRIPDARLKEIINYPDSYYLSGKLLPVCYLLIKPQSFEKVYLQTDSEKVIDQLNEFFNTISDLIIQFGGTIESTSGETISAIFGSPASSAETVNHEEFLSNQAVGSIKAALKILDKIHSIRRKWLTSGLPSLEPILFISSGEALTGFMGTTATTSFNAAGPLRQTAFKAIDFLPASQLYISDSTYCLFPASIKLKFEQEQLKSHGDEILNVYRFKG